MPIENRNLEPGTRLVATYKKQRVAAEVVEGGFKLTDVGEGLGVFDLDTVYKSPSSAGSAIMGGIACNGWRFWSLEGEEAPTAPTQARQPAKNGSAAAPAAPKGRKVLSRVPNQKGVPEGHLKIWCNACMKSHVVEGSTVPETCPEGHGGTIDEF